MFTERFTPVLRMYRPIIVKIARRMIPFTGNTVYLS